MHPHRLMPIAVVALQLCAQTAHAFDARNVDILTFRLGMSEDQVTGLLAAQGIPVEGQPEPRHACLARPKSGCLTTMTAATHDGVLALHFRADNAGAGGDTVDRIVYTFRFHTSVELGMVRDSVLGRYGPPTVQDPPTWCSGPDAAGGCPADQPRLVFQIGRSPTSGGTLTLIEP